MRVCSLLPSATEIVGALGLTDTLVGVSAECDWPPEVRGLPVVTASRIETEHLASAEIDRAVRAAVADGRDLYAVESAVLERLQPDVILTQDLCAVCAVSSDGVPGLRRCSAEVVSVDAHTLAEIEESVIVLADLLGAQDAGRTVVARMQRMIAAVREGVRDARPRTSVVGVRVDGDRGTVHGRRRLACGALVVETARSDDHELGIGVPYGFPGRRIGRQARAAEDVAASGGLDHLREPVAGGVGRIEPLGDEDRPPPRLAYTRTNGGYLRLHSGDHGLALGRHA